MEEKLERWRYVLERRGMKVNDSKTRVNERNPNATVRLQGAEMKKVEDFKFLGQQSRGTDQWKRGEEVCASRWEWVEKSVCDV